MAFFGQKWKKQGWILKGNEKFALWKCLYFYSKMHWDQDIRLFIFFSSYPFGGILDTLPLLRFQFRFFCFFTNNQPHIYLIVRELFSKKFVFWHALIFNTDSCTFLCVDLRWHQRNYQMHNKRQFPRLSQMYQLETRTFLTNRIRLDDATTYYFRKI